jgi:hypothetical protein
MKTKKDYRSAVLVLAWPETTARGEEKVVRWLKSIGFFRNTNLRVGHAAMALVQVGRPEVEYYDFGRYITPRPFGRVRSAETDPKVAMPAIARWSDDGILLNPDEIGIAIESRGAATHGDGPLLLSVCRGIDYYSATAFSKALQEEGYQRYGGLSRHHTNCARFVSDAIRASLPSSHSVRRKLRWPLSVKPTPEHNVAASATEGICLKVCQGQVQSYVPNRWKAMLNLAFGILKAASKTHASALRNDSILGQVHEPSRPDNIPSHAQWLGGLGEGAWHVLDVLPHAIRMERIDLSGQAEFEGLFQLPPNFHEEYSEVDLVDSNIRLLNDTHRGWITVFYAGKVHRLRRIPV